MRRAIATTLAAALTAAAGVSVNAAAGTPAAPGAATASAAQTGTAAKAKKKKADRCATRRPTMVTFRLRGTTSSSVSWKRPKSPRRGALRYRVLRDGKVVRQTRGRSVRMRVSPKRTHRIVIRAVRNGRVSSCGATLRVNMRLKAPAAPVNLAVASSDASGATLAWEAGKSRKGGKVVGYRVFRDGKAVRQVAERRLRVSLPPRRTYTFTVAAVDTAGRVSAHSAPVKVEIGHQPPSVPANVRAETVGDAGFRLAWDASTVPSGRVVGYRVMRDGATLGQTADTSMVVGGLVGDREYQMSVVAVDDRGYVSAPAGPLAVRTAPPEPTQGGVHAFVLATTSGSFRDLQERYKQIGTAYPTYYECDAGSLVHGNDNPLWSGWIKARGIQLMPRLDCQDTGRLHRLLTDPAVRGQVIARMAELVRAHGYDGVQVDFEKGDPADKDALTQFVAEISNVMHGMGKKVSVAVSAKAKEVPGSRGAFYDYAALGNLADHVFVMNWGKHWSTSKPGAIADLPWARSVADYVATMPNKGRFVLGSGLYGMDWPNGGGQANPAVAREWQDVQALIASTGATPRFDETMGAPTFSYTDAAGVPREVWYTDARSMAAHIRLARDRGLGIGFWRLGKEDPAIWADPLLAPGVPWPAG